MAERKRVIEWENARRPLGVTLIALLVIVVGIVTVLFGLLGMLAGFVSGIMDAPGGAGLEFLVGFFGLVLGIAYLIAGLGLLSLAPWAWWLGVFVGVVGFVMAFGSPVWMLVWAILVVYMVLVRNSFGVLPDAPRILAPA